MNRSIKLGIAIVTMAIMLVMLPTLQKPAESRGGATEAPAGFDNVTNGHISQLAFDAFPATFEEEEEIDEGLGPTFNNTACVNCHNVPVTGGSSRQFETRAGYSDTNGNFVEHPGGSVVQDRATNPSIRERVLPYEDTTKRASVNTLGDGFVEAIDDATLINISKNQPPSIRGVPIWVPILEATNGSTRVGRFGWKNQHASLVSFSADAYLNEMGITSPLQPVENTSDGNSVAAFDDVPEPEDGGGADVNAFAQFMRATKVPPRNPALVGKAQTIAGEQIFHNIGCDGCHIPTIVTAPADTMLNGGFFKVSAALGNKIIHPYSDFLLHNIGTHDPIVQNGGPSTYNMVRTAPLWGLRNRASFLHDFSAQTLTEAITSHGGQAKEAAEAFAALPSSDKERLLTFLESL
jgi:CxxC motif-containing protein (DUF1111 family)